MALGILGMVVVLLIPAGITWRIAFNLLRQNPTPQVKVFFWASSVVFIALGAAAFTATRFIE